MMIIPFDLGLCLGDMFCMEMLGSKKWRFWYCWLLSCFVLLIYFCWGRMHLNGGFARVSCYSFLFLFAYWFTIALLIALCRILLLNLCSVLSHCSSTSLLSFSIPSDTLILMKQMKQINGIFGRELWYALCRKTLRQSLGKNTACHT
jgi:hypothetical protein